MALTIDSDERFGALFVALPWELMKNVWRSLPAEYIPMVFLKAPSLRKFIVETYYSEEICLCLADPDGKGDFWYPYHPSHLVDLQIEYFFAGNPDIVPKQYSIFLDLKYTGLEGLLESFGDVLGQAGELEIEFSEAYREFWPERQDPSKQLTDLIFSFRNLVLLKAWFHKGHFDSLSKHENLENFTLHAMGKIDWSAISLPSSLKTFQLYLEDDPEPEVDSELVIDSDLDFDSEFVSGDNLALDDENPLITYDEVFNLFWNNPGLTRLTPDMSRCPNLTELTLNDCRLEHIDFSLFPRSLTSLDLLCNAIDYIEYDSSKSASYWPENLTHLALSNNFIPDWVIYDLSKIRWPSRLESLNLYNNHITSLKFLFNLPETLHALRLDNNHYLTDLNLVNDGTGYRIENLPDSLEELALNGCKNIKWGHLGKDRPTQVLERLHLPPNLTKLDLFDSRLKTTKHIVLPAQLETVNIQGPDPFDDMMVYDL